MFPYILLLYNFEIRNYQNYMHTAMKGKVKEGLWRPQQSADIPRAWVFPSQQNGRQLKSQNGLQNLEVAIGVLN